MTSRSRVQFGQVDVHRVVSERVIERRADDFRPRRQFRIGGRVEFDLIRVPFAVGHAESRLHARGFAARHLPAIQRYRLEAIRATHDIVNRHRVTADAVDEPRRVRHLVERVDVHRPEVPPLARRREGVDDEVVAVGVLDCLHRRGVGDRVVVDPQGIVGIEVRPRSRYHADRAEDGNSREPDDGCAQPARCRPRTCHRRRSKDACHRDSQRQRPREGRCRYPC